MRSVILFMLILGFVPANAAEVRVTGVNDVSLGQWGMNDSEVNAHMDMCIYSSGNSPSGSYSVKVTSNHGAYVLKKGADQIAYTLYWEDSATLGTSSGTQLSYNALLTARRNANTNPLSQLCLLIGNTARLYLKITKPDLEAARAGLYEGVINIIVSNN